MLSCQGELMSVRQSFSVNKHADMDKCLDLMPKMTDKPAGTKVGTSANEWNEIWDFCSVCCPGFSQNISWFSQSSSISFNDLFSDWYFLFFCPRTVFFYSFNFFEESFFLSCKESPTSYDPQKLFDM